MNLSIEELVVWGMIMLVSIESYCNMSLDMFASSDALTFISLNTLDSTYESSMNYERVNLFFSSGLF